MTSLAEPGPRTLIDELLAEQQSLTAVDRFARQHGENSGPAQARYYRDLIPLAKPQLGEQYAFAVDLDACTGCKACVSACHSLNGLDDDEIWRNVGLLHGGTGDAPYQQTVTTACHHCVEPACLEGCPVRAYEKDAETGIVRHLDDQCIGCQYCVLKCPYDVPKYSTKRGIVRKCDMCQSRLAANEAPACVQACPTSAISIRVVSKRDLTLLTEPGEQLLPGAFDSHYTKPTTSYTTRKSMPANARPGDGAALRLEHAHAPLIGMLVFTQIAVGLFAAASLLPAAHPGTTVLTVAAFAILQLGLGVSVLHLGRPLGAWRAFLGLRTSWMSREIFAFGAFSAAGGAAVLSQLPRSAWLAFPPIPFLETMLKANAPVLLHLTTALGLFSVFCSAMIYIDTRRAFWQRELTFTKFFGATFLLGTASAAMLLAWTAALAAPALGETARAFALAAMIIRTALFGWEFQNFQRTLADDTDPNHRSALTIWRLLRPLAYARVGLFAGSTLFAVLAIAGAGWLAALAATASAGLTTLAVFAERYTFFTAVVAPRMPGPLTPRTT